MKRILLLLLLFVPSLMLFAQADDEYNTLVIELNDGTRQSIPLSKISCLLFDYTSDENLYEIVEGIRDEDLYNMILELPDAERTVLNMFVFEGFSHKEIASLLGIKESASAMRFYRAKAHLAEMIEKYEKR